MKRVTDKELHAIANRINREMGTPLEPYTRDADGIARPCVGNYHISFAYGGAELQQMVNESGSVRDVLMCGHIPRRELQTAMFAFIQGIYAGQEKAHV
jgi:hypothetical protein